MTASEFKAWFEGMDEGIIGLPTMDQWNKIRDKIKKLEDRVQFTYYSLPTRLPDYEPIQPYKVTC